MDEPPPPQHIDDSGIVDNDDSTVSSMSIDEDAHETTTVQQIQEPPPQPEPPWEQRCESIPPNGTLRPLIDPIAGFEHWWGCDRTLTEWLSEIDECDAAEPLPVDGDIILPGAASLHPPRYTDTVRALFSTIQRQRWLARKVLWRLQQRIWSRRPQCGVDLIDMEPIPPADVITLTDTRNRAIYHFHRRDIFNNLLSNITAADEFLPTPRPPTNPWTNQPLTLPQILAICQQLVADWARRGTCPPVLFAAFCASGYDIRRYESENPSLLGQHAIQAFFREIHDHNRETFCETLFQLLADAGINFSSTAIRRWTRQTPLTPVHREWLAMARDYTLWLNLHIQPRRGWSDEAAIYADVRVLYSRSPMREADTAGPRLRALRNRAVPPPIVIPLRPPVLFPFGPPTLTSLLDVSGNADGMDATMALALIQQALFRM